MSNAIEIGSRVFISDYDHPWAGYSGVVISGVETYGLGWTGQRVEVDGSGGHQTYVQPHQLQLGPNPARPDRPARRRRPRKDTAPD
jgi:hypothetical protein